LSEGASAGYANENESREADGDCSGCHLQGIEVPAFPKDSYEDVHLVPLFGTYRIKADIACRKRLEYASRRSPR
jgi:hypothetical protein